ncbi:MAG: sulfatase-like hydrolase/transferase [Lentisphaeraceae bacterium]|nr:sulfatase-like hydrolase/transferase [Lentisphaeraceae bacterium]
MYKSFLFLILLSTFAATAEKPNVLFIFTDDQSTRSVSCYEEAHDWVKTPNIDSLAKQGVRFDSAYIGTWCMASRLTILSGLLQHGQKSVTLTGNYPSSTYDPKVIPFWPAIFRKNGYTTAHIGKWHSGNDSGYGRDWDHQIVWNRPKYAKNYRNYYYDQEIEINGQHMGNVPGYSTDNYTKWSEDFIRQNDKKKPWFLWVCYGGPHGPFTPADRHLKDYPNSKVNIPKDTFGPRPGKPQYLNTRTEFEKDKDGNVLLKKDNVHNYGRIHGDTLDDWIRQYNQVITSMDEGVGTLIKSLKETGQYENTLIIFASDQGFAWGQHGLKSKFAAYDAAIKAPLIISYPEFAKNKSTKAHISGADLPATIADVCDIKIPWRMDGRSILPLLKNPDHPWDFPVLQTFSHIYFGEETKTIPDDPKKLAHRLFNIPWWSSVVQGNYKYIQNLDAERKVELYNLKEDPEELYNLADKEEYKQLKSSYKKIMLDELKRTRAEYVKELE